jgi:GNAT superfamily N-acetyltransferase
MAAAESRRPRDKLHAPWIAVTPAGVAAYGYYEEPNVAARAGRIRIRVMVDPAHRGAGLGGALYDALEMRARAAGATELVTEAWETDAGARALLVRRGFAEYHRRIESRLTLSALEPSAVGRGIDRMADAGFRSGIRIASYRQLLLAFDDAPRRLYDLDATLWADVPFGLTGEIPTFEQYQALELADPDFLPQATFVALHDRRWIGLAALANGRGFLLNSVTGVVRDWRGHGLARWLKLHTLRWALERGTPEIRTFNDAVNGPILALNCSLGFRVQSIEVRYRKDL